MRYSKPRTKTARWRFAAGEGGVIWRLELWCGLCDAHHGDDGWTMNLTFGVLALRGSEGGEPLCTHATCAALLDLWDRAAADSEWSES